MIDHIKATLLAMPELANWPDLAPLIARLRHVRPLSCLEHPRIAAQALGVDPDRALPGSVAVYGLQAGIHLIDDMIDHESTGLYRSLGEGATANLATALIAAGFRAIAEAGVSDARRARMLGLLASTVLTTAHGQALDAEATIDEAAYWRLVEAKSTPLFGAALAIGGTLAGADEETSQSLERIGRDVGTLVQIHDDLGDAMDETAQPDWQRPGANLAMLYAASADHPQRERFVTVTAQAMHDEGALSEAQAILVRSGAISYCCYKIAEVHGRARALADTMSLPEPTPIRDLLEHYIAPLEDLLRQAGAVGPEGLRGFGIE